MKSQERRMKTILLLQTKRKDITVNYLANFFGVSRRTIFRDLRFVQELDVPVAYEEGEGYSIPRGYNIPPLMFSDKELSIIMVGLSFVKSQPDEGMVEDAKSVQLKIENVVPEGLRNLIRVLDEGLLVDPYVSKGIVKSSGGDWYSISNAIANKNEISFNYKEGPNRRVVKPYLLVYFSDHWNVIGYDNNRESIRNFKIDHISNLDAVGKGFEPDPIFDVGRLLYGKDKKSFEIRIKVEAAIWSEFKRSIPTPISDIISHDNSYVCTFSFDNLEFINSWLLRFGNKVKILHPNKLIEYRRELLDKMTKEL